MPCSHVGRLWIGQSLSSVSPLGLHTSDTKNNTSEAIIHFKSRVRGYYSSEAVIYTTQQPKAM